MEEKRKRELVGILLSQKKSKESVDRLKRWIVKHAKYVKEVDEEIRAFANVPDVPEENALGCLFAINEIFVKRPKLRSYFAVGLEGSVKCLLRTLRDRENDVVEKLVRKWTRNAYYPEYVFFSDRVKEMKREKLLKPENISNVIVERRNSLLSSSSFMNMIQILSLASLPFFVYKQKHSILTFLTAYTSLCCLVQKRKRCGNSKVATNTIRVVVTSSSVTSSVQESDDRVMWNLWLSQHYLSALTVALETRILEHIMNNGSAIISQEELEIRSNLGSRGLSAILHVLRSCGLVNLLSQNTWTVTATAHRFLSEKSPYNWRDMLLGSKTEAHEKLLSVLRIDADNGGVGQNWEIGELSDESAAVMTSQFHAHSANAAYSFARTVFSNNNLMSPQSSESFEKYTTLLDVAGGSGCFSVQMALRCPSLYCTIFELPVVATYTRKHIDRFVSNLSYCSQENCDKQQHDESKINSEIRKSILGDRVKCSEGSMWWSPDKWPKPKCGTFYDAVLFSNVFHDWSFEQCKHLASSAMHVLRSGGRIYIHEIPLDNDNSKDSQLASLLSLHMLIYTSEGAQRSSLTWCSLLEDLGFLNVNTVRSIAGPFSIITGLKP